MMRSLEQLRHHLRSLVEVSAGRLIETGTAVVVTYGGGPANQYGLQSSGAAIVSELGARSLSARHLPVVDGGLGALAALDPDRVVVWVTDPYLYRFDGSGRSIRRDLREELTALGLTVVSQSVECSTGTLDKDVTAAVAAAVGLTTIPGVRIQRAGRGPGSGHELLAVHGAVVAKPVDGDEGRHVVLAASESVLDAAVTAIHEIGSDALVEPYIHGTEVGVPVLVTGAEVVALPAVEVSTASPIVDFDVKSTPGALQFLCPPRTIDGDVLAVLADQAVSLAAHLNAATLVRVDFIVDGDGTGWFLEANSFPGLSPTGMAMASLTTLGLNRGDLALLVVADHRRPVNGSPS